MIVILRGYYSGCSTTWSPFVLVQLCLLEVERPVHGIWLDIILEDGLQHRLHATDKMYVFMVTWAFPGEFPRAAWANRKTSCAFQHWPKGRPNFARS